MLSDILKTRTCEKCRLQVPLAKVKLFPKNRETNLLVCDKCHQELSRPQLASRTKPLPSSRYVYYSCTRCRYPFRADASKVGWLYNLKCPYCGRTDKLQKKKS